LLGETPIRRRAGSAKRGFTLVEVIVVLVILAILAAIATPALTGYIDKARDKQWIVEARDAEVAVRATVNELYAEGLIDVDSDYFTNGLIDHGWKTFYLDDGVKPTLGYDYFTASYDGPSALRVAADLLKKPLPAAMTDPGDWDLFHMAPTSSSYNLLDAPAFMYRYYPEGRNTGKKYNIVLYGFGNLKPTYATWTDMSTDFPNWTLDPSAGYKVLYDLIY
jgi:prepilin-type N-terminal cleavage/methylation domain-containing protein